MSIATTAIAPRPETLPQPLACRLRRKQLTGRGAGIANMGEVEIENVSSLPLEIGYQMTLLQYLNIIVTDANEKVVSEGHFGDRFAPTAEPMLFRLEPGEKITANVHLFSTVPIRPIPSGSYFVQAVYEYDGLRCVSEPLTVVVGASNGI